METKMKALDLFSGAGGASMGLLRAGFEVIGVDIKLQPRYPKEAFFIQFDALDTWIPDNIDFVWASPPCQRYSRASKCRTGLSEEYPDLVETVRRKLAAWGGPYIIENVPGAPLLNPIMLCGAMFNSPFYRHRLFESNVPLVTPRHPKHIVLCSPAGHWRPGTYISIAGNCAPISMARQAMGIDWMTRAELAEAIPPMFSDYLGRQVIQYVESKQQKGR